MNIIDEYYHEFNKLLRICYKVSHVDCMNLLDTACTFCLLGGKFNKCDEERIQDFLLSEHWGYYGHGERVYYENSSICDKVLMLIENGTKLNRAIPYFSMNDYFYKKYVVGKNIDFDFLANIPPIFLIDIIANEKLHITQNQLDEYIVLKKARIELFFRCIDEVNGIEIKQCHLYAIAKLYAMTHLRDVLLRGCKIDDKCLEESCLSNVDRTLKMKFILNNKITPNKICFDNIVKTYGDEFENNYEFRKKHKCGIYSPEIELLLLHGYKLTFDDIKFALLNMIIIKDISKFNIKFDVSYLHACSTVGIYPYSTGNIKPDITCLLNECKKCGSFTTIKNLINVNNLVPTTECLQEACKLKNNLQTIKYLLHKGAVPDIYCIENLVSFIYYPSLTCVIDAYKNMHKTNEQYNMTITNDTCVTTESDTCNNDDKQNICPDNNSNQIVYQKSQIPENFDYEKTIDYIPENLKNILKLEDVNVNFFEVRRLLLDFVKDNNMISNKNIVPTNPLIFAKKDGISLENINNWVYELLYDK